MKSLLLLPILFLALETNATASSADEVACETQKIQLHTDLSRGHAFEVEKILKDVLINAYQDLKIPITEGQIEVAAPIFTFSAGQNGEEELLTELNATVHAGNDSITAHATSLVIFTRYADRFDDADKLGRVTTTRLVCSAETYSFDVEVYNSATKILLDAVSYRQGLEYSVELP